MTSLEFDIAIGKNRQETRWRNEVWSWERLVNKLRVTHRTTETVSEYAVSSKARKAELKDVGGFVGGYITGGRRKSGSVQHRQLVTLDLDYAESNVWDDITLAYDCAAALYSTHSHTPQKPRFRLIIPLNRKVNAEEYEAIARRVAADIGIDQFDDSTYQVERLMFWPSTSKNGEYVFEEQDGEPLDADSILGTYRDWRDSSQWEISSRIDKIVRKGMKKQGDPLEKPGAVGRFCRAYTIHEAIAEFLPDVYEQTDNDPNRYTYKAGSTAGGLVTYDDKFAYSHHGTDPIGGNLVNAFDIVRLHKFAEMDEDAPSNTAINKLPSYLEMERLVGDDDRVKAEKREITAQRLKSDFGDILDQGEDETPSKTAKNGKKVDSEWMRDLETDKKGNYVSNMDNIILILENQKGLKENIKRNELLRADVIEEDLPWRRITEGTKIRWGDDDDISLVVNMERIYGITGRQKILDARSYIANKNRYQPVRDYLDTLEWDRQPRLENLFIDHIGAEDDEVTRAITRKMLTAAVARTYEPGCKFDYIMVIQGAEGIGKSTILRKLGKKWFTDSITDLGGKEGMEQIQGYWIEELGELVGIRRNEVETMKAFISRQTDSFRPAYGRTRVEYPRQCVFFATTNETEFLKGDTGNRRFWIAYCNNKPTKDVFSMTSDYVDQVWAEAKYYYEQGEELYLPRNLELIMREKQKGANEFNNDAREGIIEVFLQKLLPEDWSCRDEYQRTNYLADEDAIKAEGVVKRTRVCAIEILVECFHEKTDEKTTYKVRDINNILARIPGWSKFRYKDPRYGCQRGWKRDESPEDDDL